MAWSLRDFDRLDPKLFKAFMAAAETSNFTHAANNACMTQSGVSQHISKLEQQVGHPLFNRIGRQVKLTDTGENLVSYIRSYLTLMDEFRDSVNGDQDSVSGLVTYMMPASCLRSPHFSQLLEKRLEHKNIELDVRLEPSEKVIHSILSNKVDFGFITGKAKHPDLTYIPFCDEEYILAGAPEIINKIQSYHDIIEQKFVRYPGFATYCDLWMSSAFGYNERSTNLSLRYSGTGSTFETAIIMTVGKLGISIFPRHCVQHEIDNGKLQEYPLKEKLLNTISIVKHKHYNQPIRIQKIIDWFLEVR